MDKYYYFVIWFIVSYNSVDCSYESKNELGLKNSIGSCLVNHIEEVKQQKMKVFKTKENAFKFYNKVMLNKFNSENLKYLMTQRIDSVKIDSVKIK